ncbi:MAG: DNA-processing protein DprA [bacterium]
MGLLGQYSRRSILNAMQQHTDVKGALLDGRLADTLVRSVAPRPEPTAPPADTLYNCAVVGLFDADFPALLKTIADPPLILYHRGPLQLLQSATTVAVVGARRCTSTGRGIAQQMAQDLAGYGLVVVSGLALGIDGAAHRGALCARPPGTGEAPGHGATVAVLGSGLDHIYPQRHRQLAADIVRAGGLLLSEYAPASGPRAHHFPERNRLISGLSRATVVVEASEKSGSLITARLGLEQGRDVMAVPGPVSSLVSAGCHRLIQQGAALVTDAADVLLSLGIEAIETAAADPADHLHENLPVTRLPSDQHRQILAIVEALPVTLDDICLQTGLPAQTVSSILVSLELLGFVQQVQLGYIRSPSRQV